MIEILKSESLTWLGSFVIHYEALSRSFEDIV